MKQHTNNFPHTSRDKTRNCKELAILTTFDGFICFQPPVVGYRLLANDMWEAMEVSKKSRLS
jgi:hypothetical protein